jgi:phosphoribosylformimino-5-aminoimidazole carboxamide ribotide isomerase
MIIYPAIDLIDGHAVRLLHGDFNHVTRYDSHPANRLAAFTAEGAEWIHVIDLDGAQAGEARQYALIGDMAQAVDIKVQSGGGVRSEKDIEHLLGAGISRVVVGSLAVTDTDQVLKWLEQFGPEAIALALDVRYERLDPVVGRRSVERAGALSGRDAAPYPDHGRRSRRCPDRPESRAALRSHPPSA